MQAPQGATEHGPVFRRIEFRGRAPPALEHREAKTVDPMQRLPVPRPGRGHRQFRRDQLRRECMLFTDLRIAPAAGSIELDDHRIRRHMRWCIAVRHGSTPIR